MRIIKIIYIAVFTGIVTIFWATFCVLFLPFFPSGDFSLKYGARNWGKTLLWLAGIKVKTVRADRFDTKGLYLFMSNHKSALDILALFVAIPMPLRMVSKKTYLYVPFMGWAMWAMGFPFVDRADRKKAIESLRKTARDIREKRRNILIYPEGTRSRDGSFQPFKKGPFYTAEEVKIPIVPVIVMESDKLLKPNSLLVRKGVIYVYFGEPIPTEDYEGEEGRAQLSARVRAAMEEMINIHLETVETGQ
ncbi:MAG: lysophospholipid acyltransferase family protein [Myxococcota bacterium]